MALREKIEILNRFVSYPIRIGKWVAMVSLTMALVLITANTVMRYIFNSPIKGAEEVVELMMVLIVFLSLAYASTKGSDIAVTTLASRFPPRVWLVLGSVFYFASAAIVGLIGWRGIWGGIEMWRVGEETGVLQILIFPFLWVLAFGTAVLFLKLLVDFISFLLGVTKR